MNGQGSSFESKRVRAISLALIAVFTASSSGRLFKHGPEFIFGLHARTWGFAVLGLALVCIVGSIVLMAQMRNESQR